MSIGLFKHGSRTHLQLPDLLFFLLPLPFLRLSFLTLPIFIAVLYCGWLMIRGHYPIDTFILLTLFLFIIGELLSLFQCPDLEKTLSNSTQKIFILLLLYPLMDASLKMKEQFEKGMRLYRIGCVIMAILSLASLLSVFSFSFIQTKYAMHRLSIGGFGPNVIARMFLIGALSSLYEAQIQTRKKAVFYYGECILISGSLMATLSTSGIMLFFVGAGWVFLAFNRGVRRMGILKIVSTFVLVLILALILYRFSPFLKKIIGNFIRREQLNILLDQDKSVFSIHGRLDGLSEIMENFHHYFLVGIGYGCSSYLCGTTIHFPLISAWFETGILGFISCCALYGYPVCCAIKLLKHPDYTIYSIIALIIVAGDMVQPNPNYWFTWYAVFLPCIAYRRQLNAETSAQMIPG